MAHVGILFCLYDHLKQLKEENIMAYMSEEGYKKLMAELKELETCLLYTSFSYLCNVLS